jgi:hypothetical protein
MEGGKLPRDEAGTDPIGLTFPAGPLGGAEEADPPEEDPLLVPPVAWAAALEAATEEMIACAWSGVIVVVVTLAPAVPVPLPLLELLLLLLLLLPPLLELLLLELPLLELELDPPATSIPIISG